MNIVRFERNGVQWVKSADHHNDELFKHCCGADEVLYTDFEARGLSAIILHHGFNSICVFDEEGDNG